MSSSSSSSSRSQIKFLTYNVWSCEHVAVYRRIRAICGIIERHDPGVIFLQVTRRPRNPACDLAAGGHRLHLQPPPGGSVVRKLRRVLFLLDTLLPCGNKQLNCMYDFYGEWRY